MFLQREIPQILFPLQEEHVHTSPDETVAFESTTPEITKPEVAVTPIPVQKTPFSILSFIDPIICGIWAAVVIAMVVRTAQKSIAFHRIIAEATPLAYSVDGIACSVVESPQVALPTICGIFRPTIVLPSGLASTLQSQRMEHIFRHEIAHWKRGDILTGWLTTIVVTLHWFNPLVWIAAKSADADREEAADAFATKNLDRNQRADYGETLIQLSMQLSGSKSVRVVPGVIGIMESKSFLARRIEAIVAAPKFPLYAKVCCGLAVMLIAATLLTSAVKRDGSEKVFGVLPIPKKETPNLAEITYTKIPSTARDDHGAHNAIAIKGKFVTPNGEPLEDANFRSSQFKESLAASAGGKIEMDGSFSIKVYYAQENVLFFDDKNGQWAAPPFTFKMEEPNKTEYELIIPVFPARHVVATVRDKETGEPLRGIRFEFVPLYDGDFKLGGANRSRSILPVYTDEDGKFRYTISTGEYLFGIASAISPYISKGDTDVKSDFVKIITVKEDSPEPVEIAFDLPKLYTARLLNADGSPAKNQSISFRGYAWSNEYYGTTTDDNGNFQVYKTPEFVEMSINSGVPYRRSEVKEWLHLWLGNEISKDPDKYREFRLLKPATIRARFVDSDGNPIEDFSVGSLQCNKPGDVNARSNSTYGFNMEKSEVPGEFIYSIAIPNVEYHFGGQFPNLEYQGRQDALIATATRSGEYLDLGDITIEAPTPFVPRPWIPPRKIPFILKDASGKINRYDYATLELWNGGSTGRGTGPVSDGELFIMQILDPSGLVKQKNWLVRGFRDPTNRWAAKPIAWSPTTDWDSISEIDVNTEKGEMIRGVVLNESTGKPVERMPILLVQKVALEGDNVPPPNALTLHWNLMTDSKGEFAVRMVPGEFGIGIGNTYLRNFGLQTRNKAMETWTRNFMLESGKPVDLTFRIPAPFVGRVLTTEGNPAPKASVEIKTFIGGSDNTSLTTDDHGEFRLCEAPDAYSYITFQSDGNMDTAQRLIRWIEPGETGTPEKPMIFRLSNVDVIGRLLDKDGAPFTDSNTIYVTAERDEHAPNAWKYKKAPSYFTSTVWGTNTNKDGLFRVSGLTPGVKYTLQPRDHGNEDAVIITPAAKGNTIDLGNWHIDR